MSRILNILTGTSVAGEAFQRNLHSASSFLFLDIPTAWSWNASLAFSFGDRLSPTRRTWHELIKQNEA